jgi:hypothetical protein
MLIVAFLECATCEARVSLNRPCVCPCDSCLVHQFISLALSIQGAGGWPLLTVTTWGRFWHISQLGNFGIVSGQDFVHIWHTSIGDLHCVSVYDFV